MATLIYWLIAWLLQVLIQVPRQSRLFPRWGSRRMAWESSVMSSWRRGCLWWGHEYTVPRHQISLDLLECPRRISPDILVLSIFNPDISSSFFPVALRQFSSHRSYISCIRSGDDTIPENYLMSIPRTFLFVYGSEIKEKLLGIVGVEQFIEICSDVKP